MKVLVLQGSPRKRGHTKQFSDPFMDELRKAGAEVDEAWLYDKEILPCLACKGCQDKEGEFGCVRRDDMHELFDRTMEAGLLVLSSPIYAFFATAPVKAYMDRLIYTSGKYYGKKKYPPLTQGKRCAVLTTSGYPRKLAASMFEDAVRSSCKHIGMEYLGGTAARDPGGGAVFMTPEKEARSRAFARELLGHFQNNGL